MSVTRTGGFPIGFRQLGSSWQKPLAAALDFAVAEGFSAFDLGRAGIAALREVAERGLRLGAVDLPEWAGMISPDAQLRREAVARNAEHVRACAEAGPVNHFVVMLPEKPELPRRENFGYLLESFGELAGVLEAADAKLVIEGWPGPGALCCTPEGLRALFAACPSPALGVNYDPSHLVRMGVDPLRFLDEFLGRVHHVHAKDALVLAEDRYLYGREQPATFAKPPPFGGASWRYTLPGQGLTPWREVLRKLAAAGYRGAVSVELEDADFHGSPELEQLGLRAAKRFLEDC